MDNNKLNILESKILTKLVDAYERKTENSNRRVIIAAKKFDEYDLDKLENKNLFINAVRSLSNREFIEYVWVKYEENNLLEKIILNEEKIDRIYLSLNRKDKETKIDLLLNEIDGYLEIVKSDYATKFLNNEKIHIKEKARLSSLWPDLKKDREDFIKLIKSTEEKEDIPIRYLSVRLFSDSKRIERDFKSKLISVAKKYVPLSLDGDEVLLYLGIIKNPMEILFCGDITYYQDNGQINTKEYIYGTSINQIVISKMESIIVNDNSILTIENKSTYYEYIKIKPKDQLVIYLGGFFGKTTRDFIKKLYKYNDVPYYHWSDIDLGGFRIFRYLNELLERKLKPVAMDEKTYEKYLIRYPNTEGITKSQNKEIEGMLDDDNLSILKNTMILVTKRLKRLEQECIMVCEVVKKFI